MTDTPSGHKATPEQWEHLENGALIDRPYNSARVVLELRDRIAHLEQMRETEKAAMLDIYAKLERLKLQHESNWARIVKLEEAQEAAPAAEPAASDDARQEFLQELHGLQERALREGIGPRCDMVEWARLLWNGAPAAEPATDELPPKVGHILRLAEIIRKVDGKHDKGAAALAEAILSHPRIGEVLPSEAPTPATAPASAPAGSLLEVVAALIANGIACDREEERIAVDAIAAVAEWLERHHTGRIANGSQFADLLREALEREAGR
jgi:hypothetical protein